MPAILYSVDVGDRVAIRQPRSEYAFLAARVGTVVEVFRVPLDSCLVHLDDDPHREREWFFYREELTITHSDLSLELRQVSAYPHTPLQGLWRSPERY